MNLLRRVLIAAAIGTPLLVAGCAATAPAVAPGPTIQVTGPGDAGLLAGLVSHFAADCRNPKVYPG